MAEDKRKPLFDADEAGILVKDLRRQFGSGTTKSYEWRVAQLEGISRMIDDRENEIVEALYKDLSKPKTEAYALEVVLILTF